MGIEPDFSYTITMSELCMAGMPTRCPEDLFAYYPHELIQRTERETETRSERFDRIGVEASPYFYGYRVHVWMKPKDPEIPLRA